MPKQTSGQGSGHPQREALDDIQSHHERIREQLGVLDDQAGALDEEESRIDSEAARLAGQLREVAAEEARLQKRRHELQGEERALAERRADVASRRKKHVKQRQSLQAEQDKLDARKSEIERQLAYEDTQKQASVVRASDPQEEHPRPANQRSHQRVQVQVQVEVSMHTEHNFYTGLTENISEGGLFIATYEQLPIGTTLDVKLSLPDHPPIESQAQVRWVREHTQFTEDVSPGVGVQFIHLEADQRQAIESFLQQRPPLFFETD